ncbi:MAG: hypothetical protein HY459_02320 [Parcubacteria group bacterium]|nr:hypothetical protein [Parcubacteria group bacterium]
MQLENVVKGRIAETLVNELLRRAKFRVYRFGYEAVLQNLTQIEENVLGGSDEVSQQIRSIPDFLIIKEKQPFFVEVKFLAIRRTNLKFYTKSGEELGEQLIRIRDFWKAKIIIVTGELPYFNFLEDPYFNPTSKDLYLQPLEKERDLGITEAMIREFNRLVEQYLRATVLQSSLKNL